MARLCLNNKNNFLNCTSAQRLFSQNRAIRTEHFHSSGRAWHRLLALPFRSRPEITLKTATDTTYHWERQSAVHVNTPMNRTEECERQSGREIREVHHFLPSHTHIHTYTHSNTEFIHAMTALLAVLFSEIVTTIPLWSSSMVDFVLSHSSCQSFPSTVFSGWCCTPRL